MTDSLPGSVAIIGLGLIGGSLARDLLARGVDVLGYDRDAKTARSAAAVGVRALESPSSAELATAALVVLAVPVTTAAGLLTEVAGAVGRSTFVTDLGSTKRSIVRAAERAGIGERFVGSHPLAGDHRSGWGAAREGLFVGAPVFLCRARDSTADAIQCVTSVWRAVGARPEELGPEEHDRQVAWTSHLPQAAASALAAAIGAAGWRPEHLGPGGRDATRLAASSPEVWSAISADNADLIDAALGELEDRISAFRTQLRAGDLDAIERFFSAAHRWSRESPPAP